MNNNLFKFILTTLLITFVANPLVCCASQAEIDQKALSVGKKIMDFGWKLDERAKKDPELSKVGDIINNTFFNNKPLTASDKETMLKTVQKYPDMLADVKDIIKMWDDYQKMVEAQKQKK
jgi:hypothetical protein